MGRGIALRGLFFVVVVLVAGCDSTPRAPSKDEAPSPAPTAAESVKSGSVFRIVDASGTETAITDLSLDYSNRPLAGGFYTPDIETRGIRIRRGEGRVTVPWSDITVVDITAENIVTNGVLMGEKVTAIVRLNSGNVVTGELVPVRLTAKSELGKYEISPAKMKQIRPMR